jgi:hypothetical protein
MIVNVMQIWLFGAWRMGPALLGRLVTVAGPADDRGQGRARLSSAMSSRSGGRQNRYEAQFISVGGRRSRKRPITV